MFNALELKTTRAKKRGGVINRQTKLGNSVSPPFGGLFKYIRKVIYLELGESASYT